ncbi:MAG: hypothetical protein PVH61_12290 [Candidatus Aminicenantes bacterium]|jgi:hypothetical protein
MKRVNGWKFILAVLILTVSVIAKDLVVVSQGEASGTGLNAKEKSLENALRNAVEKGFGVYIDSTTLTENAALISDQIVAETKGFVRSYDVLEQRTEGGLCITNVRAVVSLDKVWESDSLHLLLKRMGAPRFIILSNENIEGEPPNGQPARQKMTEALVNSGFHLVDSPKAMAWTESGEEEITGNFKNAIAAAKDVKAEIIVFLKAKSEFEKRSRLYGKDMIFFNGICEAKVIQTDTAAIISTAVGKAGRGAENPGEAVHDALSFSSLNASEELIKGILAAWAKYLNMGRPIEIVVKNISVTQLLKIVESLKSLEGVKEVTQREFARRTAYLEIKSKHESMYLAESIERINIPGSKIEVNEFSTSKIRLTIH